MNLDINSVIKAGAIGAAISAVIGILGALPVIGPLFWVCACFGGLLVPVGAGALYGYFAPGKEDLAQGAVGGALSGFAAGLFYGILNVITTAVVGVIDGNAIGDVFLDSSVTLIGSFCGAIVFGSILGAIGGAVWLVIQGREA